MAKRRTLKIRPTYREHSEDSYRATIRAAIPKQGIFVDYLAEVTQERVDGPTEFERGVAEGRRRLAGDLLGIALSEDEDATDN